MNKKQTPARPTSKNDPEFRALLEESGKAQDLQALRNSNGGKALVKGLVNDIIGALTIIATDAAKLTHSEFIVLACRIKERIDIATALSNAKTNAKFLQEEVRAALEAIDEVEADENYSTTHGEVILPKEKSTTNG